MQKIDKFQAELMKLKPEDDEFLTLVDDLIESIPEEIHLSFIPSIFKFFETHPLSECGMPGGLVHLVEKFYPSYERILKNSLQKTPSYSSMLMVNRILNSNLSKNNRKEYTDILVRLSNDNNMEEKLRSKAKSILKYQLQQKTL